MFGKKKDVRARVPSSPETRYQSARSSLLLVVVLTAINLLLLVMRSSTQFLFSASFPSYLYIIADEFADYLGMGTVLRLGALRWAYAISGCICCSGSFRRMRAGS